MKRFLYLLEFSLFYFRELVACNLRVAYDILTPTHHMQPAFVSLPCHALSERQLLVLANLITMTPGTLSLYVQDDLSHLVIHCMYADDPEALIENLQCDYVRRVCRVF